MKQNTINRILASRYPQSLPILLRKTRDAAYSRNKNRKITGTSFHLLFSSFLSLKIKDLHMKGTIYKGVCKFKYLGCSVTDTSQREDEINISIPNVLKCTLCFIKFWCPCSYAEKLRSVCTKQSLNRP